jgi:hypothetical protein
LSRLGDKNISVLCSQIKYLYQEKDGMDNGTKRRRKTAESPRVTHIIDIYDIFIRQPLINRLSCRLLNGHCYTKKRYPAFINRKGGVSFLQVNHS